MYCNEGYVRHHIPSLQTVTLNVMDDVKIRRNII